MIGRKPEIPIALWCGPIRGTPSILFLLQAKRKGRNRFEIKSPTQAAKMSAGYPERSQTCTAATLSARILRDTAHAIAAVTEPRISTVLLHDDSVERIPSTGRHGIGCWAVPRRRNDSASASRARARPLETLTSAPSCRCSLDWPRISAALICFRTKLPTSIGQGNRCARR